MLIKAYRGEYGDNDTSLLHTRHGGYYFSGDPSIASGYAMNPSFTSDVCYAPRVYPMWLKFKNPFIVQPRESFLELVDVDKALGRGETIRIAIKFSDWIEHTNHWTERLNQDGRYEDVKQYIQEDPSRVTDLYFDAYAFFADTYEVSRLVELGYDGAIHKGNGETLDSTEYCVFNQSQAASIFDYKE